MINAHYCLVITLGAMDCYMNLPISDNKLQQLITDAKDFVYGLGSIVRSAKKPLSPDAVIHAPFTLFPSPVLRSRFLEACSVQTDMNLLMHRVANDSEFLENCLHNVIKVDDFTGRLWRIYETVRTEGIAQPITLALNRSDYMIGTEEELADVRRSIEQADIMNSAYSLTSEVINESEIKLRQIEFNTMASSFAGLSQTLMCYHRYFIERNNLADSSEQLIVNVPENMAASGLASTIVEAWFLYGNPKAVILFLVAAVERNIYDQRSLEYHVYEINAGVKVIRRTLQQICTGGHLSPSNQLIVDNMEVAIVYQRSCYKPSDFTSEDDWQTRLMIERSKAVVCPNIAYHLAGTKKVQQVLAQRGVVEKFIDDTDAVARIRSTFAEQYSLDMSSEGDANVEMAVQNPTLYVLKPQREGGGNNTFGEAVRDELMKMRSSPDRSSYVLMKRVHPLVYRNYPISAGCPVELRQMVSELGIFGSLLANGDEVVLNRQQGYLLRTKMFGVDEGGVATGYSVLDSPLLVDSWPLPEQLITLST